jgi:hypothetical protein
MVRHTSPTKHRLLFQPAAAWLLLVTLGRFCLPLAAQDPQLDREYIRLGQRVIAIEYPPQGAAISPTSAVFPANPGPTDAATVTITASGPWSTSNNGVTWVGIAPQNGSGNGQVVVTVAQNLTGSQRTATVTIAGLSFGVTQAGASQYVTITGSTSSLLDSAGNCVQPATGCKTIAISSNTTWTASTADIWISITPPGSGAGNGQVSFTVPAYTQGTQPRTGFVDISGQLFQVTQNPPTPLNINPLQMAVPAAGGTGFQFQVAATAGLAWTAASEAAWLHIQSGASGVGPGTVTFQVDQNPTTGTRVGGIRVIASGSEGVLFQVIQDGRPPALVLSPSEVTLYECTGVQLWATVDGVQNNSLVEWSISPSGRGFITPAGSGYYVAPCLITGNENVTVTATSKSNPSVTATAMVHVLKYTVGPSPAIEISDTVAPTYPGAIHETILIAHWNGNPSWYSPIEILFTGNTTASSTANGCNIQTFVNVSGAMQLTNDEGTGWVDNPNPYPGSPNTPSNSQCLIRLSTSNIEFQGYQQIWIRLHLGFKPAFGGLRRVFARAVSSQGEVGEWIPWTEVGLRQVAGYQPPTVTLDAPANGAVLSGSSVSVSGWALDNDIQAENAISKVEVFVDGAKVGDATYGDNRPDACALYSGRQGCPNVGFHFNWNTTTVPDGQHELLVVATDTDATPHTGSASRSVTVNNGGGAPCAYSLGQTSAMVGGGAASGAVNVVAPSGCAWEATSNKLWIQITSGAAGSGAGTVTYSLLSNSSTTARTGTLVIAGQTFTIEQAGTVDWYSSNWTRRKRINIASAQVSGTHNHFPILVRVTDAGLRDYARSDGFDILFTLDGHTVKLNHEIERFVKTTGELVAWVRLPTLSAAGDYPIYMYYGNPGAADQSSPTAVWDSTFKGVWHLREDPGAAGGGGIKDSTANANHGAGDGSMTAANWVDGRIGKAIDFDGADDYIRLGNPASLQIAGQITISAWVNTRVIPGAQIHNIAAHGYRFSPDQEVFFRLYNGKYQAGSWNGVDHKTEAAIPSEDLNTWVHLAATYDGHQWRLYRNGAQVAATANSTGAIAVDADWAIAARGGGGSRFFNGRIDELRIAAAARGAGWIATEYNSQKDGSVFLALGPQETLSACSYSIAPASASPGAGATSGSVNVTAGSGCNWTATSNAAWITITSGGTGSGNGTVNYSVQANTGSARQGTLTIAGHTFTITQAAGGGGPTWYDSGWGRRKALTIQASQVSGGPHSNFPLLVPLSADADLAAHTQSNGNDLLFTLDDHTTKLDHEIEAFNGATGELVAWVRIPALSNTANTTIYLYYGNPGASNQQNRSGVWDAHHRGVWHLGNGYSTAAGFYLDSTANANHATLTDANANSAAVAGKVGGALQLAGDADFINAGAPASLNDVNPRTIELWLKRGTTAVELQLLTKSGAGGWNAEIRRAGGSNGPNTVRLWDVWGNSPGWYGSTQLTDLNPFYYVVITYDSGSTGNNPSIYIDGVADTVTRITAPSGSHPSDAANPLRIGAASWGEYFNGVIDEVRISAAIRSPGWIATTYNNIHSPGAFVSVAQQESLCSYSLSAGQASLDPGASSGNTVGVTAGSGCPWTASSDAAWISITSGASGTGNGTVTYSVQANSTSSPRQGTMLIAGHTFTVNQEGVPAGPWYNTAWGYRKPLTIQAAKVGGSLTNFPILVRLPADAQLAARARPDGNDLLFTLDDHATKLDHEIESFNGATGELAAWVRIPSLSNAANTTIYLYYGNAGASNQQNRNGVWDAHHRGVWHLGNGYSTAAGFYTDSTANANHGTLTDANANSAAVAGKAGGALDLNGDADFLNVGSASSLDDVNPRTLEFWIKREGIAIMQLAAKSGSGGYFSAEIQAAGSSGANTVRLWEKWSNNAGWRGATQLTGPNKFYYVVVAYDSGSTGNSPSIYIDGVAETVTVLTAPSGSHASDAANAMRIGAASWGEYFSGVIDEVRLSAALRPPAWIAATYNTIHSPETFLTPGPEEAR